MSTEIVRHAELVTGACPVFWELLTSCVLASLLASRTRRGQLHLKHIIDSSRRPRQSSQRALQRGMPKLPRTGNELAVAATRWLTGASRKEACLALHDSEAHGGCWGQSDYSEPGVETWRSSEQDVKPLSSRSHCSMSTHLRYTARCEGSLF